MTRPVTSGAGVSRCGIVLSSKRHLRRRLRKQKQEQEQKQRRKPKSLSPWLPSSPCPATLKDLQAEFIGINPKKIASVGVPTLHIPFPIDIGNGPETEAPLSPTSEDYWQWISYIVERGQELVKAAGIKGSKEPRYAPEHMCWRLWVDVTWYEDLYCTLSGSPKSQTLMERDRDMSAIVLRISASAAAEEISRRVHAHAKDVETLRNLLDAKEAELLSSHSSVASLQAELREAHSSVANKKPHMRDSRPKKLHRGGPYWHW